MSVPGSLGQAGRNNQTSPRKLPTGSPQNNTGKFTVNNLVKKFCKMSLGSPKMTARRLAGTRKNAGKTRQEQLFGCSASLPGLTSHRATKTTHASDSASQPRCPHGEANVAFSQRNESTQRATVKVRRSPRLLCGKGPARRSRRGRRHAKKLPSLGAATVHLQTKTTAFERRKNHPEKTTQPNPPHPIFLFFSCRGAVLTLQSTLAKWTNSHAAAIPVGCGARVRCRRFATCYEGSTY